MQCSAKLSPTYYQLARCLGMDEHQTGRMKTDIDSIHLGIKYPCDLCEYQATERGSMKVHINRVHRGI